ncbi:MAG: YbgC/FadM family acyl-CoA thioesterase, partial [Helicobacter sp.]|nr:YbgC/FadM family acyl-CoA thioesterase [Helicobacter sp.]
MQIRIYYEDTDCGGIVYHANYLKFCERARSEWFFSSGLLPNDEKFGFVVKNMQLEFLQSSKLGDVLEMHAKILQLKHASIVLEQWITLKEKKIFFATLVL